MIDSYAHLLRQGDPAAPLVVACHGTGGDEHQFAGLTAQLLPGATLVAPRGDVSEGGAARFFRRTGEGVYDMDDLARAVDKMAGFVRAHVAAQGARRVLGLAYSNGANILAAVAFRHPDIFTDLALLHPLIPWQPAPQPGLAGRRILVTAGERDPICPAPLTRALVDYLRAQGATVTAHWHPGGHRIEQVELAALAAFLPPQPTP